jgi:hypothetical protein
MESTTDELMFSFHQANPIDAALMDELEKLLQLADLVKFAKAEPMPEENEQAWQTSYQFVKQTLRIMEPVTDIQETNGEEQAL